MNNDLISREALKKALIEAHINRVLTFDIATFNCVMSTIDNAPTVEPFEPDYVGAERLKARQRGYADGYRNGMEIGKTLNPKIKQGKWIEVPVKRDILYPNGIKYVCSACKRDNCYGKPLFCMWCGADMREDSDE